MEAALAAAGVSPDQVAAILAAHQQALAAAVAQAAQSAAQPDAVVRDLRTADAVTALLKHSTSNKSTVYRLKNDLSAAIDAIDAVDDGNCDLVSNFREKLSDQRSTLGAKRGGYASNQVKMKVLHALEVFGVTMPAQPLAIGWNGEQTMSSDDEAEDEMDDDEAPAADAALPAERQQVPPAEGSPAVVRAAFDLIMSSATMRRSIRFDLAPFLLRVHQNVLAALALAGGGLLSTAQTIKMFGGGRTQARKTPLKAAQFILCRMMGVPTLLLTTNVSGREDLFHKFAELLSEIDVAPPPQPAGATPYAGTQYEYRKVDGVQKLVRVGSESGQLLVRGVLSVDTIAAQHRSWAVSQLREGACIVSNNTAQALSKLGSIVREARGDRNAPALQFMLTIDEADDFYRTDGECYNQIKLEQALDDLKELGPLVCFEVSATLLAVYMALHREGGDEAVAAADLWYVEPCDDYVGAELLMPPQDARGEFQFIHEHDLKKSNMLADAKVRATYADAAGNPRSLLLDATTSAVTAANQIGIFDKGRLVQHLHPHAVVVVVSGSLIKWWTVQPRADRQDDCRGWELRGKDRVVGNVISKIDKYYPDRPIFVFGYSQMVRGVSYRSRRRVPSHFVLLYKTGMPLCRLVQAAGRAMGEQARQLRANGFNHVVMLTQPQDYDAICAYPEFLKAIKQHMEVGGASLADALRATYAGKYNVFSTPRELGAKRLKLAGIVQTTLQFAPTTTPIGDGNAALDRELGAQGRGPRRAILEVLLDCDCLDDESAMGGKDVHEELATGQYDMFFGEADTDLSVPEVTKILKELCIKPVHREPILESNGRSGKSLGFFINEEGLDALPGRADMPVAQPTAADVAAAAAAAAAATQPMLMRQPTMRERELQAAEAAAAESGDELHAAVEQAFALGGTGGAGPSGPSVQPTAWPMGSVDRPRRGSAAAAVAGIASCAAQLLMGERCDERPEDLLPLQPRVALPPIAGGKRKMPAAAAAADDDDDDEPTQAWRKTHHGSPETQA